MFKTLSELGKRGFIVEARQTDKKGVSFNTEGVPIVLASREDMISLKKLGASGVPFTIIKNRNGKTYSVSGYQSFKTILELIKKAK